MVICYEDDHLSTLLQKKNIERNLESDTLGDLVLLFTNMCYFQEPWKYETHI